MNQQLLQEFEQIPQPGTAYMRFIEELKYHSSEETVFAKRNGTLHLDGCIDLVPETVSSSLENANVSGELFFRKDPSFVREEFSLEIRDSSATLTAAEPEGFRRGGYFFLEHCEEKEGYWRRKPLVKNRISRCFFGPTYRPPLWIDELSNEVDYYPEAYLERLSREGVNGLWLTMYFWDMPSEIFPGRGSGAEKRFQKLRHIVEKCARYGIRIFIYFCEPKLFGDWDFAVPEKDARFHPEIMSMPMNGMHCFCTSTSAGKKYLHDSVKCLFDAVPDLGGIINIMYGEDNGSCAAARLNPLSKRPPCPVCSKRKPEDLYAEYALSMVSAMPKTAEFIGWFYSSSMRDNSALSRSLSEAVSKWPENASVMFNFETGAQTIQLGRERTVFDYSLAFPGPSKTFREVAGKCKRVCAKLQVGCSHEDASLPFMPVPSNLFRKYRFIHKKRIESVLQCWYFGNYPGLMNRAAGILSFEPFPAGEKEFLLELTRPLWKKDAERAAEALRLFAEGYRSFPANLAFKWYGPMHSCIAWPLYLFPVDKPMAPSWLLKTFPEISGDRIGECLAWHHTLPEALTLMRKMLRKWSAGMELLATGKERLPGDYRIFAAVFLQIKSVCSLLEFYSLREDMLYTGKNNLSKMHKIVLDEIGNTDRMILLCEADSRIGYHSEAEGYLFFPEKLRARIGLLKDLLNHDFVKFRPGEDRYLFGGRPIAKTDDNFLSNGGKWGYSVENGMLIFHFSRMKGKCFSLEIEPCRMWPPLRVDFSENGSFALSSDPYHRIPPEISGNAEHFVIPLKTFDGFRREGFPMRINIRGADFSWAPGKPWPARMFYRDWNPENSGELYL